MDAALRPGRQNRLSGRHRRTVGDFSGGVLLGRHWIRGPIGRYGLALAATLAAFVLRFALAGWFPPGFPYLTFFPAVVVTAYFAGLRPAILCAGLSGLLAWYYFIPPYRTFDLNFPTSVALTFYAFVVTVDVFFIDGMRKAVRELARERSLYADLAESRDLLYRELHHRVSNNLQVVGALLRLQSASIADEDARRALAEASGRIDVVTKIQRELHNAAGAPVPFRDFADAVLRDAADAAGVRVELTIEGGEKPLHPDQATPVTLVMLESFNNALEHGFAGRGGQVHVALEQEDEAHVLTVRDNGAGPPEGFDATTSMNMGLRIVRAMAQQLNGKFEIVRDADWTICRCAYAGKPYSA